MNSGRISMDMSDTLREGFDVGLRSFLFQQTVFDKLGMSKFAGFVNDVADGSVESNFQIALLDTGKLDDTGNADFLRQGKDSTPTTGFGPQIGNLGVDHTIPTNADIDARILGTGAEGTISRADPGAARETASPADSVEHLTRATAGLFRQFSYLTGFVQDPQFQTLTNQPNYQIPKPLNDTTNNTAEQNIVRFDTPKTVTDIDQVTGVPTGDVQSFGTFTGGGDVAHVPSVIVRQPDAANVTQYYEDIRDFLNSIFLAQGTGNEWTTEQVRQFLNPANYNTPSEFVAEYNRLKEQINLRGTYDAQISVDLPQQAEIGFEFKPLPKLRLTTDLKWFDYSDTQQKFSAELGGGNNEFLNRVLGLRGSGFGDARSFDFVEKFDWHDQWVYNFGGSYDLFDNLTLMAGFSFTGRRFNDLWTNFGEAASAMDSVNSTAIMPAYGFRTYSGGMTYRWNNKAISLAFERATTTRIVSGANNKANPQYSNSSLKTNQDSVHVQYSLLF